MSNFSLSLQTLTYDKVIDDLVRVLISTTPSHLGGTRGNGEAPSLPKPSASK